MGEGTPKTCQKTIPNDCRLGPKGEMGDLEGIEEGRGV